MVLKTAADRDQSMLGWAEQMKKVASMMVEIRCPQMIRLVGSPL